jgi:hypothetical protein
MFMPLVPMRVRSSVQTDSGAHGCVLRLLHHLSTELATVVLSCMKRVVSVSLLAESRQSLQTAQGVRRQSPTVRQMSEPPSQ